MLPLPLNYNPCALQHSAGGKHGIFGKILYKDKCRNLSERAARSEDADPVYGHLLWQLWRNIRSRMMTMMMILLMVIIMITMILLSTEIFSGSFGGTSGQG